MKLCHVDITLDEKYTRIVSILVRRGYLLYDASRQCVDYYAGSEVSKKTFYVLLLYVLGMRDIVIDEGYTVEELLVDPLRRVDPSLIDLLYS